MEWINRSCCVPKQQALSSMPDLSMSLLIICSTLRVERPTSKNIYDHMTEKMLILPSCRSTLGSGDERCFCANQSGLLRHLYGRASNSPCLLLCAWFSVNSRPLRVGGGMRHASDAILTILTQLVPASGCFFCATTSLGLRMNNRTTRRTKEELGAVL